MTEPINKQIAVFATGCFWCTEAVFQRVTGVLSVTSGYIGGTTTNPIYEDVSTGETGHAEALEIVFDANKVTYSELLQIFWQAHDPTTLNRQGADVGTQYRSAIFYKTEEQKELALASRVEAQKDFSDKIVTAIEPVSTFYPAELYHQDFYNNNPNYGYCRVVISPKLQKLGME